MESLAKICKALDCDICTIKKTRRITFLFFYIVQNSIKKGINYDRINSSRKKTEKYNVLKKMNGMYPSQKKKLDKSGYVNL